MMRLWPLCLSVKRCKAESFDIYYGNCRHHFTDCPSFRVDLLRKLSSYSADCAVANGKLTIKTAIGTRTLDAGALADVPVGLARQQFRRMIDQHEATTKKP
jgi:hypothetical protein